MNEPAPLAAREAAAVTAAALALSGHEIVGFTYDLTTKMGRGELTGDQAAETIITRFMRSSGPRVKSYSTADVGEHHI